MMPAFDVSETDEHIIIKADLPGIDPKDLDISLSDNVLAIRGERKEEHREEGENFYTVERQYGAFTRSLTLPADVKEDAIEATYKDGVLRLTIPKAEQVQRKKIEIKTY